LGQNVRTEDGGCLLKAGTRIPLAVMNTVSSRNAAPGQQVYLQTIFPVVVENRIVIPAGSHVTGVITDSQRPGRVAGRGELFLRFDTLILPGGAALDLRARIGSLDGGHGGRVSDEEGRITSEGRVGRDAWLLGLSTAAGALLALCHASGAAGAARGTDAAAGAGAGGALGLGTVLRARGPEAMLRQGSTLEMVLTRDLKLTADEIGGR
jgi:type IV secretion system protein VirB10